MWHFIHSLCFMVLSCTFLAVCKEHNTNGSDNQIVFKRTNEPKENAFSVLVPESWKLEGGIFRIDPTVGGGTGNAIAAKCDMTIKKDPEGTIMIRWLPDMLYMDMRGTPAAPMFPAGSNYNGMVVLPKTTAEKFILEVFISYVHPQIQNLSVIEQKSLDQLSEKYQSMAQQMMPQATMNYDAAMVVIEYNEGEVHYREVLVTLIEDYGALGAGLWGNKETFLFRAPVSQFEENASVISIIRESVRFNNAWLTNEMKGQMTRSGVMINTQKQVQQLDKEIVDHQSKINAEIHNDVFLTLTESEEYVNPFNNEIETGSNEWQFRWINEQGDVIYTDREDYDPNIDIKLHEKGFKRSEVRKRFGE